jgi:4-aminobutyrate aminotransferase
VTGPDPDQTQRSWSRAEKAEGDVNLSPNRAAYQAGMVDPAAREWLDRDAAVFFRQSLSTPCLDMLTGADGARLTALGGRRLLDFHGNSVHHLGHGHPAVIRAVRRQMDALAFCPRRYTNAPAVELAELLCARSPCGPSKVLFAPGGTTAVGMALKLARAATGRFKTVSFWDSFHGASLDAVSVGGEALFRKGAGPLLPGAVHVPPPDPGNCLFDPSGDCASCGLRCAAYIDYVMAREGDVGALVAEPLRATTVVPPPPGYWTVVRRICDRHGALLVFDETAVGLGRTGRLFACEHFGAAPDMVVLGKALGGGIMPLAALVARAGLDVAPDKALGHYTHEKNPVACAAGLAALRVILDEDLPGRAASLGGRLLAELAALGRRHGLAAPARGLGLALALPVGRPGQDPDAAAMSADRALYECLARGVSFKVSGGDVLTLTPPLTISGDDADLALSILDAALAAAYPGNA